MKLSRVIMVSLALALASCASRETPTVELPGGVNEDARNAAQQRAPNFFDRMIGNDQRPNVGPCPLMGVLYDNARTVQFQNVGQIHNRGIELEGSARTGSLRSSTQRSSQASSLPRTAQQAPT